MRLAFAFALVKFLLHLGSNLLQAHLGWGYWRDELYYLYCGHQLAWGYVDFGPLIGVQARLAEMFFGSSLAGIRMFVALAGAGRVFLTGILTFRLGGQRLAQTLAMTIVLTVLPYLGQDSVLNPGPLEPLFWIGCLLALLALQERLGLAPRRDLLVHAPLTEAPLTEDRRPRLHDEPSYISSSAWTPWITFGLLAGVGLLNKPSMTFFLIALGLALLLTDTGRRLLLRRETLAGVALLLIVPLPNLVWQWLHKWPTIDFLQRLKLQNGPFHATAFLLAPLTDFFGPTVAVWGLGVLYLLLRRHTRYLGLTYLFFMSLMVVLAAKPYYTYPLYPLLFAAGSVAWERVLRHRPRIRVAAFSSVCAAFLFYSLYVLPLAIPTFSPEGWLRYTGAIGLYKPSANVLVASPLPAFFADRFGWQEEADEVTRIVATLAPSDRAAVVILCDNYREAGALRLLAPSLPPVVSGNVTFYLWGYGHATGDVVLAISSRTPEDLQRFYRDVAIVGNLNHSPYMDISERHVNIYLLHGPRQSFADFWTTLKS